MLSKETIDLIAAVAQRNANVPPTQQGYIDTWGSELGLIIAALRKEELHKIDFRANLMYGHEGWIPYVPLDTLKKHADGLVEAGCTGIDMNFGLSPWLNEDKAGIEKHDALVKYIKDDLGCHLALNFSINPAVKFKFPRFSDYLDAALKVYPMVAARYEPNELAVIHEPTTIGRRLSPIPSQAEWTDFTRRVAEAVQDATTKTRVVAGYIPWLQQDVPLALEAIAMPELDVISVDNYSLAGMDRMNDVIAAIKASGKPAYIEETWRSGWADPKTKITSLEQWSAQGIGLEIYEPIDEKWLEMTALLAAAWGMEAIVPFWTSTFFCYQQEGGNTLSQEYTSAAIQAINAGKRTKLAEFYKKLSQELGK